jgi:DNA-binding transcriptional MerR regulator/methylmalonyl-CoA mutase cobalamin-binding subunit
MYTIKQAAVRASVSVPLLRAWERRYGIVEPARTPAGYRLYDEGLIARLRAMRRLVNDGWSPSSAAASLRALDDEAIQAMVGTVVASNEAAGASDDLTGRFVSCAGSLDSAGLESALDEMFARGSFEQVVTTHVLPSLAALGDAWAAGRLDVAAEHAASHAVLRRLGSAFAAAGRPADEHSAVLVGLPPGARHELGALAFAVAARRAGLPVLFLGSDLPVQDWVHAAKRTEARAAVIGVVMGGDVDAARRVARALHVAQPGLLVAFGGESAPAETADERTLRLPADLLQAVDVLRAAILADDAHRERPV